MNLTRSQTRESVDYRRSDVEQPTATTVIRVTYTLPLEHTIHQDFTNEFEAAVYVLAWIRQIRMSRRGNVTVQAL